MKLIKGILVLGTAAALSLNLGGCSDKVQASVKVIQTKSEDALVHFAGEGEVALELYRQQYGVFKEKLVRLKTLQALYQDELDQAVANKDLRKTATYEKLLSALNQKVPQAEKNLTEFWTLYENQKDEIRYLKDDIAIHNSLSGLSDGADTYGQYEERGQKIKELTRKLKEQGKRSAALLQVNELEEKNLR